MNEHQLLLFDLDNTLLCSPWFNEGLIKTLRAHPKTRELDERLFVEKMLNVPQDLLDQFKRRDITPLEFRRARWKQSFDHFNVRTDSKSLDEIDDFFLKTGMGCINENKEITDLLVELKAHYQLGIVTNGLYDARLKIKQMQLANIFPNETIFDAEQIGFRKPDSEIYSLALKYFGKKPMESLFIGDSWIHDVVGPMDAGMEAIWVNEKGIPHNTHHPFAIVSDVLEIKQILLS